MSEFGKQLRSARKKAGLTQQQLAEAVGVTQGALGHLETGRQHAERSPELVEKLERVLGMPAGALAQYLPSDHPARLMAAVEIPVLGVVAAGPPIDADATTGETLRVTKLWAGCVAYRVRGASMLGDQIREGDYLVVRPEKIPEVGQIVVVWIDGLGHVVKKYTKGGFLRSSGKDRWSHKLVEGDRIYGVLVSVVRVI